MKKTLIIVGIVLLVGWAAYPVLARNMDWGWGPGYHMRGYGGGGPGYCWSDRSGASELTDEQRSKLNELARKYSEETAGLREQMWNKRSELESLLDTPQPDADKVKAVQKELNALRAQMDEKRLDHELEGRKIAPDARYGMRYGRGTGSGGPRGFGPGACWR